MTDKIAEMNINQLADYCYQQAKGIGWWDKGKDDTDRSFSAIIALIHTEVSEAYEEFRNGHRLEEVYYTKGKPEGIPVELADAMIRILDFCGAYGIDIGQAVEDKLEYNETRGYRHGGKFA